MNNTKDRLWNKNFILIIIASTGVSFATYFFLSTIPVYAQSISGSNKWAGVMTGVYSLAALVSRPITGYMVDRVKRIIIAFAGAVICLLACLLYNFAGIIAVLIIFRFLHGFGFGMHTTSANTIAIDMIPPSRRIEGIGNFGLCMTFASAVAPALALPLITNDSNGILKLSLMAASLIVVTLVSLSLIKYNNKPKEVVVKEPKEEKVWKMTMKNMTALISPSVMVLLISIVQGAVISFLALYALDKGFESIGFYFTFSAAGMIISRLFAGRVGDKYGVRIIMLPALILFFLSLLCITLAPNQLLMILIGFPYGLALGAAMPIFNVIILDHFPDTKRGAASSLYFACIDVGIGGGSILLGYFVDMIDYKGVFIAATVICLLLFAWYYLSGVKRKQACEEGA